MFKIKEQTLELFGEILRGSSAFHKFLDDNPDLIPDDAIKNIEDNGSYQGSESSPRKNTEYYIKLKIEHNGRKLELNTITRPFDDSYNRILKISYDGIKDTIPFPVGIRIKYNMIES